MREIWIAILYRFTNNLAKKVLLCLLGYNQELKNMVIKIIGCITTILFVLCFSSCTNSPNADTTAINTLKIDLSRAKQEKEISQIFSEISLVKLETTPNSLIGEINKIFLSNNLIYISDGLSVYLFDMNGQFKKRLHNNGKGPGEYTGISDFVVGKNNTIEILNSGLQKVIRYDSTFSFIDEYKINRYAMNMALLKSGERLFHCGNDASGDQYDKILQYEKGKQKNKHLKISPQRSLYLHYRRFDYFSYYNNGVITTDAHHDTVYFFDGELFKPIYAIDIGAKAIPKHMYDKSYADIAHFSLNHLKGSGYSYGVFNFIESSHNLLFRYDERIDIKESEYGRLRPTFVHYNKPSNKSDIFYYIADDVNFIGKPRLNEFTTFFSQPNGYVAYAIQAYEFIRMYNQGKDNSRDFQNKGKVYPSDELIKIAKPTDNPIIVIGKLK